MHESTDLIESQVQADCKKLLEDFTYYLSIGHLQEAMKLLIIVLHLVTGAYTGTRVSVTFHPLTEDEARSYGETVARLVNEVLPA